MPDTVPLYDVTKIVGDEVIEEIREVLYSGWLTLGSRTDSLEAEFASQHGVDHGIAVNSCTSALYAALRALDIGPDDTVVVPAITFSATANVVRLLGAEVILCDTKDNGNIDPTVLRSLFEEHDISAVIPVHLYGLPCDIEEIVSLAGNHGAAVIEDCAHAPGATIDGQSVGSFGDIGCFSFYATKNMTTGEGGMAITDDEVLSDRLRKLRNHHQTKSPEEKKENWGYDVDGLGFNFRMSEIEAAIGLSQLGRLPEMNASRQEVARNYIDALNDIQGLSWRGGAAEKEHVFHLFVIHVEDDYPLTRNELYDALSAEGIITGVHYPPISTLSYYDAVGGYDANSKEVSDRILSIPMFPNMSAETQSRVIDALKSHAIREA